MDNAIYITVGDYRVAVTLDEAVTIRDSLCSRLGCPSFCCDEVATSVDGGISLNTIGLVSSKAQ